MQQRLAVHKDQHALHAGVEMSWETAIFDLKLDPGFALRAIPSLRGGPVGNNTARLNKRYSEFASRVPPECGQLH